VEAAIGDRALVHPGAEDRGDRAPELLLRVLRERLAELARHRLLVALHHRLPILGVQVGVEALARVELVVLQQVLEMVVIDAEHDLAVHLDEASVAVIGEAPVAAALGEPGHGLVVEAEVQHRVHHAGHRGAGTRAHGDQQRILGVAELGADALLQRCQRGYDLRLQLLRIAAAVGVEVGADLGRDGEARRHRQSQIAHLREIGALAAEEVAHVRAPLGAARSETVNPLRHRPPTLRSRRSRRRR
jgi:hypothetical protein